MKLWSTTKHSTNYLTYQKDGKQQEILLVENGNAGNEKVARTHNIALPQMGLDQYFFSYFLTRPKIVSRPEIG